MIGKGVFLGRAPKFSPLPIFPPFLAVSGILLLFLRTFLHPRSHACCLGRWLACWVYVTRRFCPRDCGRMCHVTLKIKKNLCLSLSLSFSLFLSLLSPPLPLLLVVVFLGSTFVTGISVRSIKFCEQFLRHRYDERAVVTSGKSLVSTIPRRDAAFASVIVARARGDVVAASTARDHCSGAFRCQRLFLFRSTTIGFAPA